jgi:hypothetical protein
VPPGNGEPEDEEDPDPDRDDREDERYKNVKTKEEEIEDHYSTANSLTYRAADGDESNLHSDRVDVEDHFQKHHGDQDWTDNEGQPLQVGGTYELKSSHYEIPDRITVVKVAPGHVVYTTHTGDVDYKHELTKLDQQVNDYIFAKAEDGELDSETDPSTQVPPVRPGQDPTPQIDDLSTPSTVVSNEYTGSFNGDNIASRDWLNESSNPVEVDPAMMAKLAGKDYTPREQREFIDEAGPARNLDKLDLTGTHYNEISDDDPELALW